MWYLKQSTLGLFGSGNETRVFGVQSKSTVLTASLCHCSSVVHAGGSLCKSCLQAGYRIGCSFAWSTGISGFCLQSHLQALSLLLVVAGDVERNPGPLTGMCAIHLTSFIKSLNHSGKRWVVFAHFGYPQFRIIGEYH